MPRTKISEFSSTPASNTDIDSINISEGCAPSGINDAIRELMAQLKDFQTGAVGDSFNGPVGTTTAAAGAFTTLAASSTVTLSGGTANGVAYLNGSKVVTSGSALTFDGTNLALTGTSPIYKVPTAGGSLFDAGGNNGIYILGSSNYVATFAAGSEQMRLTSTGLGIGTSSPKKKLTVSDASSSSTTPGTNPVVWIGGGNVTLNTLSEIGFIYGGNSWSESNVPATVGFQLTSTAGFGKGDLTFCTRSVTTDTAPTERMRLDSAGNLGLGVTPSAWDTAYQAIQLPNGGTLAGYKGSVAPILNLSSNAYYNSGDKYVITAAATQYSQNQGVHKWFNAPSGTAGNAITFTQAMTLDASGNLGVGTTSPAQRLDVRGTTSATIRVGSAGNGSSGDEFGNLEFYWADPDAAEVKAKIYAKNVGNVGPGGGGAADLLFATTPAFGSSTERARITSGGYFKASNNGTYASSAGSLHELKGNPDDNVLRVENYQATLTGAIAGVRIIYSAATPNTTTRSFIYCDDSTTVRAEIRSNGGLANYSANDVNLSDRREKTNFAPAKSYLDTICAIPVQTFNYIDQSEDDPGLTLGVVAQDVQAVAPELVMESNWGTEDNPKMRLSIYQTDLQYALMKCIQEQQAIINQLKARLDAANL